MKLRSLLISVLLSASVVAQDRVQRDPHEMHRLHQDPQSYIAMLEDPERDSYQKPQRVVMALGLREGEVIADIGAGSGYFAFRLARHVGATGRVFAVDVEPEMIRHMNRRARDLDLTNVVTVLADPDDPLLPDDSIDRFFICNTWHHVQNQTDYLESLKKMGKPGLRIIMIDFKKEDLPVGPPLAMKIDRATLIRQMQGAGFRLAEEHTFLPYQYFLIFSLH